MLQLGERKTELDQSLGLGPWFLVGRGLNVGRVLEYNLVGVFVEEVFSYHATSHDVARVRR